ncbi:BBSome-interacting protein 1 isoform X1 [Enhydra lutris kenyoni]|nr:BBSome-interacting protein 1 isoform X1 [Enhydra lutris kenyoni]
MWVRLPCPVRQPTARRPVGDGERGGKNLAVSNNSDMAEVKSMFREVLPKQGQLSVEDITTMVLCKPKLLPLKSLTLEKLEKMQQAAQDTIRQQEVAEKEQQQITH